MNKVVLILAITIVSAMPVFSQFGIKGGASLSRIANQSSAKDRFGGHLGVTYSKQLSEKFYFQPELLLTSYGTDIGDIVSVVKKGYIDLWGIEAPLNMSFRPSIRDNMKLVVDAGVYLRYGLWGKRYYEYYDNPTIDGAAFDVYNRFDFGLNMGLGIQKGVYFGGISFQLGLSDAEKDTRYKHQTIRLSLGYLF